MSCWTRICPAFANSVDPDQLAFEEANWSGSALFAVQYSNFYQQPGSSNFIGWKLEVGVSSLFSMTRVKKKIKACLQFSFFCMFFVSKCNLFRFLFYFGATAVTCRAAAIKRHHSADYIFISFGIVQSILVTSKIVYRLSRCQRGTAYQGLWVLVLQLMKKVIRSCYVLLWYWLSVHIKENVYTIFDDCQSYNQWKLVLRVDLKMAAIRLKSRSSSWHRAVSALWIFVREKECASLDDSWCTL